MLKNNLPLREECVREQQVERKIYVCEREK